MLRDDVAEKLQSAVRRLVDGGSLAEADYPIEITEPRSAEHGDFATNFALTAAKTAHAQPAEIARRLADELAKEPDFASAGVAGPGFVNIRLTDACFCRWAADALAGTLQPTVSVSPENLLIEFVSVNPNGPLHVGHGRGAAYGDTLARVLSASGISVSREYYVNDGANSLQMQLFALSVKAKFREALGLGFDFPDDGYRGDYVNDVAAAIRTHHGDSHADDGPEFWQPASQELMMEKQKEDLARYGVVFDSWFSEQSLYDDGKVESAIDLLNRQGHLFEQDGALMLRSTAFGDDKDRVVVRSDGRHTYIASDIAYHKDKFDRGFSQLIDVWGADHHGYIARMSGAVQAMGYEKEQFEAVITQQVRFLSKGAVVPMSKRSGEMVTLSELMDEVGVDVARFFYLMRSHDSHMDFDLDLAKEHSDQNPVYYVQYAHARLCSLIEKAAEMGFSADSSCLDKLEPAERELIKKLWDLPFEVRRAAADRGVHRLTTYSVELARLYHDFYERCRVISPESPQQTRARLALCEATRATLVQTFGLLGISAPQRM